MKYKIRWWQIPGEIIYADEYPDESTRITLCVPFIDVPCVVHTYPLEDFINPYRMIMRSNRVVVWLECKYQENMFRLSCVQEIIYTAQKLNFNQLNYSITYENK